MEGIVLAQCEVSMDWLVTIIYLEQVEKMILAERASMQSLVNEAEELACPPLPAALSPAVSCWRLV